MNYDNNAIAVYPDQALEISLVNASGKPQALGLRTFLRRAHQKWLGRGTSLLQGAF
jgi:hypothetical protein